MRLFIEKHDGDDDESNVDDDRNDDDNDVYMVVLEVAVSDCSVK